MTDQMIPAHAHRACRNYRRYRATHPLPAGWTETISVGGSPDDADFRVLLENPTHFLDLQLSDVHEPGDAYAYVVRRDRRLPTDDEATALAAQLLGTDTDPMPYARVTVTYDPDGRPREYHLAVPPCRPLTPVTLALELSLRYPPEL
jgi:hypothetical protein